MAVRSDMCGPDRARSQFDSVVSDLWRHMEDAGAGGRVAPLLEDAGGQPDKCIRATPGGRDARAEQRVASAALPTHAFLGRTYGHHVCRRGRCPPP